MRAHLIVDDLVVIEAYGLIHLLEMPSYQKNRALLTVVAERWHIEHKTLYLSMGEIIVMPKDVY